MRKFTLLIAICVIFENCCDVAANNSYFLPGDSFFFVRMTQEEIIGIQKVKSPIFAYGSHSNGGFGCGFAGYSKLRVSNMSDVMKNHLLTSFSDFDSSLEENFDGKKVLCIFIYNRDYDWKKHGIGIQYNENWVNETVKFGHLKEHVRLENFTSSPQSLMYAWRDSPRIAPLATTNHKISKDQMGAWTTSPVMLKSDFQLLVIPKRNFDDYFRKKDDLPLIVITKDGKATYVTRNRRWIKK